MVYEVSNEKGISDFFYCKRMSGVSHPLRIHSHMEVVFVLKGNVNITVADKNQVMGSGTMALIMPYEIHGYERSENSDVFVIACPPEYISEYRELFKEKEFSPFFAEFGSVQRIIIKDILENNFQDDFKKKALGYSVISEFMKRCVLKNKDLFEYDIYRRAIVYISENYTDNITMEGVADYIGVTSSHLSRVLNSGGKPGFSEIVNSLRIFAAKKMLERENMSVSDVAFQVGYGSIRNFNRVFKKYFGCNPSDIKNS